MSQGGTNQGVLLILVLKIDPPDQPCNGIRVTGSGRVGFNGADRHPIRSDAAPFPVRSELCKGMHAFGGLTANLMVYGRYGVESPSEEVAFCLTKEIGFCSEISHKPGWVQVRDQRHKLFR